MKTVIMAGGFGTRINSMFPDIPKPLIPITSSDGTQRPVLEWEILSLRDQGFKEIILTVGYKAQLIKDYFGNGASLGVSISYYTEEVPLGNAGALFKLKDELCGEPFLLLIADAMFDIDFNRFVEFHYSKGALVSLFTHPNSHPYDSSVLVADKDGAVIEWLTKESVRPQWYKNRVNAGLQIIDPSVLDMVDIDVNQIGLLDNDGKIIKVDMDRQVLKPLCESGKIYCYDSPEYCKDMGTPDRFEQVCRDFRKGVIASKNLKQKQKAIFLDRDGTINKYVGFLRKPNEFELIPGVAEAIRKINNSGYLAIVVTNQPVIARGETSVAELEMIHAKMETLLGDNGAYLDGLYYCPHHPDKGFKGEITELKIPCDCRKPKPGLLLKASRDYNIDLTNSWMIGDSENDVLAGKNAGCKTGFIGKENNINADIFDNCLLNLINKII